MNSDFRRIPRNETARVRLALEGSFSMWEVTHSCITCSFLFSLLKCVRVPFDRIACNTPLCSRARNGKTQTDFKIRSRHQLSPKQEYLWPYKDQYPANFFSKFTQKIIQFLLKILFVSMPLQIESFSQYCFKMYTKDYCEFLSKFLLFILIKNMSIITRSLNLVSYPTVLTTILCWRIQGRGVRITCPTSRSNFFYAGFGKNFAKY